MKNKIINTITASALFIIAVYLRNRFGLYNSTFLFIPCVLCTLWVANYVKTGGSLKTHIKNQLITLDKFINNNAQNSEQMSWYKKPKYWAVLIMLGYCVVQADTLEGFSDTALWILPLIPFVVRGYQFIFIIFVMAAIGLDIITLMAFSAANWIPIYSLFAFLFWFSALGFLALICAKIENRRNTTKKFKRPIFRDVMLSILLVGVGLGGFTINEIRYEKRRHTQNYEFCTNIWAKQSQIPNEATEQFCTCFADKNIRKMDNYAKRVHCITVLEQATGQTQP